MLSLRSLTPAQVRPWHWHCGSSDALLKNPSPKKKAEKCAIAPPKIELSLSLATRVDDFSIASRASGEFVVV
jgi:hypothetical protein